jgi:hypothetical protein
MEKEGNKRERLINDKPLHLYQHVLHLEKKDKWVL